MHQQKTEEMKRKLGEEHMAQWLLSLSQWLAWLSVDGWL
jgi:hypothetical protein